MTAGKKAWKHIKTGLWVLGCLFLGLVIFCWATMYIMDQETSYGRDAAYLSDRGYAAALGVRRLTYDDFVTRYGEPEELVNTPDPAGNRFLMTAKYKKFDLLCLVVGEKLEDASLEMIQLRIKDRKLRFGRRQIGLGSTKEEIHAAYARDPAIDASELSSCAVLFPAVEEGYYGEDWCRILFFYDEKDIVTAMAYQIAPF